MDAESAARLRRNLGDTGDDPAFSDDEIAALLAEAGGDEDQALAQGLREMIAQAAKWHDYSTEGGEVKKSQVVGNLRALLSDVEDRIAAKAVADGEAAAAVQSRSSSVALRAVW